MAQQSALPPVAANHSSSNRIIGNLEEAALNLHEIDTKNFLANQINTDIGKFRNADAFINAGIERMQAFSSSNPTAAAFG